MGTVERYAQRADQQSSQSLLHHTLNLPTSFETFSKMSEPLSCSQAILSRVSPVTSSTWTEELDRVIKDVLQQCRPGYVEIPTDAVHHKVSSAGLNKRLVSFAITCVFNVNQADTRATPPLCSSCRAAGSHTLLANELICPDDDNSWSSAFRRGHGSCRRRYHQALCRG